MKFYLKSQLSSTTSTPSARNSIIWRPVISLFIKIFKIIIQRARPIKKIPRSIKLFADSFIFYCLITRYNFSLQSYLIVLLYHSNCLSHLMCWLIDGYKCFDKGNLNYKSIIFCNLWKKDSIYNLTTKKSTLLNVSFSRYLNCHTDFGRTGRRPVSGQI